MALALDDYPSCNTDILKIDSKLAKDDNVKSAKIFLCIRSINSSSSNSLNSSSSNSLNSSSSNSLNSSSSNYLNSSSSNSGENVLSLIHPGLAHWVLSIEFDEDKVIYAEGVEKGGLLVPEVSTDPVTIWLSRKPYGSKDLSPSHVLKLAAFQHPQNYTQYNKVHNNCQHWFVKMTELLGIGNSNKTPYRSDNLALGGAIGVGGAIVMGLGAWLFNCLNDRSEERKYISSRDADSDSD